MAVKRWGQAKREVTALWALISNELETKTIREIWQELRDSGQITVCQSKFYAQVNAKKAGISATSGAATGRDLVARAAAPSSVLIPVNRQNVAPAASPAEVGPTATFTHDARARDLDELF